jgi:acyl carrier protein
VRYLGDGNLEYLGRTDYQVKVRGFRIELGEIEAHLNQHPEIEKSLVMVQENDPTSQQLVAYYIANKALDLRSYIATQLPHYMIPHHFILLDEFPLTPNGKIDRKSLPLPHAQPSENPVVSPRTPTEEILANIWQKVLKIEQFSIDNDFFALGGHSLLATQVISQIRQHFAIEIPLRYLFENSSITKLGKKIEKIQQETNQLEIPPITKTENYDLSFAQQRQWFLAQLEPDSPFYNIPIAIRLEGYLDIQRLQDSLNQVIQRHEILRTAYPTKDGQPSSTIAPEINLKLSWSR